MLFRSTWPYATDYIEGIAINPTSQVIYTVGGAYSVLTNNYYAGTLLSVNTNGTPVSGALKVIVGNTGVPFLVFFYGTCVIPTTTDVAVSGTTDVNGNNQGYVGAWRAKLTGRFLQIVIGPIGASASTTLLGLVSDGINVYCVGTLREVSNTAYCFITCINISTRSVTWQKTLGNGPINFEFFEKIAIDSSNNLYATGSTFKTASTSDVILAKYNSSGTLLWQRKLEQASSSIGLGVAVDDDNNVCVVGAVSVSGASQALVAKLDSNGNIIWQRSLGAAGQTNRFDSVSVDNSNNLYCVGRTNQNSGTSGDDYLLAKYNSSGVLQWQRTMAGSSFVTNDVCNDVVCDTANNFYPAGTMYRYNYTYGGYTFDGVFAKLPTNGSLTNTYSLDQTPLIYATSSLSDAATGLTSTVTTFTDTSTTYPWSVVTSGSGSNNINFYDTPYANNYVTYIP